MHTSSLFWLLHRHQTSAAQLLALAASAKAPQPEVWAARVLACAQRRGEGEPAQVLRLARVMALAQGPAASANTVQRLATELAARPPVDAAPRTLRLVELSDATQASIRAGRFRLDTPGGRNRHNEQLNALVQQSLVNAIDDIVRTDPRFDGWTVREVILGPVARLDNGNLPLRGYRITLVNAAMQQRELIAAPQWSRQASAVLMQISEQRRVE
jgi:hypothetical protein